MGGFNFKCNGQLAVIEVSHAELNCAHLGGVCVCWGIQRNYSWFVTNKFLLFLVSNFAT